MGYLRIIASALRSRVQVHHWVMKISKFLHSCLLVEKDGGKLLFDPGKFSLVEGLVRTEEFRDIDMRPSQKSLRSVVQNVRTYRNREARFIPNHVSVALASLRGGQRLQKAHARLDNRVALCNACSSCSITLLKIKKLAAETPNSPSTRTTDETRKLGASVMTHLLAPKDVVGLRASRGDRCWSPIDRRRSEKIPNSDTGIEDGAACRGERHKGENRVAVQMMKNVPPDVEHPPDSNKAVVLKSAKCEPCKKCAETDLPKAETTSEIGSTCTRDQQRAQVATAWLTQQRHSRNEDSGNHNRKYDVQKVERWWRVHEKSFVLRVWCRCSTENAPSIGSTAAC